jgi:hypothetical protein
LFHGRILATAVGAVTNCLGLQAAVFPVTIEKLTLHGDFSKKIASCQDIACLEIQSL